MAGRFFFSVAAAVSVALCSCSGVIFDSIRDEVKLEDAQISGDVNSIVRFGDKIYIQNGNIWRKDAASESAHGWSRAGKPDAGADYLYVNALAADSTYIYAQMTLLNENNDDGEIQSKGSQIYYSSDGDKWEGPIKLTNAKGEEVSLFKSGYTRLLCTNAPQAAHRKAYLYFSDTSKDSSNPEKRVWSLNGASATKLEAATADNSTSPTAATLSCAWFKGSVYFSSGRAMTTDEGASDDATALYRSSGTKVCWTTDGSTWSEVDVAGSTIYSLSPTKDNLYLGTAKGVEHVLFKKDGSGNWTRALEGKTHDFSTNAASTLSSSYQIHAVLAMKPGSSEADNVIYGTATHTGSSSSTSATQKNVGLWAYIAARGSWNRE